MNSLLNAFNKLDVELRLNLLLKYFQETNSDPQLAISNVELSAQADVELRHFATVTKRNTNLAIFGEVKQEEVELNLIIENLLLNYSSELLEKYSSGYSMDIKLINKKLDNIVSIKTEIEEFKNRFNKDEFKKSNDLIKDAKKGIINQLSTLNFKKVILSSDELLDDFDNYSLFLEDDHLKYVRQLIQLIDKWSSEGYVYYSLPNDSYNGMFFTFNERMFWQTSMSSFCEEINLLLKDHLDEIRLPTRILRHNCQAFTGYIIHFDDLKNWLLTKNN